jgi:rhamnulose-1-phosphate aldolase/alcohol dehydrogenase
MAITPQSSIENLWDDESASSMSPLQELVYASNLLGSDLRVTNFGGGNTSVKCLETDPLSGTPVRVLWVKGSGGDLASAKPSGFASLYLDRVLALRERFAALRMHEDDVVPLYSHCVFDLNPVACSIDTPLHAFIPASCVCHVHPDAAIAVAACDEAERLTREVWGGQIGYLPWKRPGFELALQLSELLERQPQLRGVLLASHGITLWADTWKECYALTLETINRAQDYIDARMDVDRVFGPVVSSRPDCAIGTKLLATLLPLLRGKTAYQGRSLIAYVDSREEALDFLSREKLTELADRGTSCPDHFLRTKIRPMVLREPKESDKLDAELDAALADYRKRYSDYYERCKEPSSPAMRNPNPSVVLVPGVGIVALGKNPREARITGEFYRNAIAVMKGAECMGRYTPLPEKEAFDIEYWQLEEAKLKRMPPDKPLSGKVAVVTGGAQGIGRAAAKRLSEMGACLMILDINEQKLREAVVEIEEVAAEAESVEWLSCDVTDPAGIVKAFEECVLSFGGVDIAVIGAGNARRGTIADTSDRDYDYLSDLLMKGYFLAAREASRLMVVQGLGGSIILIGSKNAVAVGSNAAIYSAAKAFELHLMRTIANDLGSYGVRCNAVNPDAVIEGSGIWNDQWRTETATLLGIAPEELPEYYRKRTLLGLNVTPEDVAEAVAWLADERRSGRTTGCVIPVDGGVREAFLR